VDPALVFLTAVLGMVPSGMIRATKLHREVVRCRFKVAVP
jgi:hypothetical protein